MDTNQVTDESPTLPLEDLLIVEIGSGAAYAGRLLAGLGARVVMIEPPGGVGLRRRPPFAPGRIGMNAGYPFNFLCAGKHSVCLDVEKADGSEVFSRAVAAAGIVLDAVGTEPATAWCTTALALLDAGPVRKHCHVAATGPLGALGEVDLLTQAASGLMAISGHAEGEPMRAPLMQSEIQAGLIAAMAVLTLERSEGAHRASIATQQALALTTVQTSNPGFYYWNKQIPTRPGLSGPPIRCTDGWAILNIPPERWPAFVEWLREAKVENPSGAPVNATTEATLAALAAARPQIEALAAKHNVQEFFHAAQHYGLPCMPVNTIAAVAADPHVRARKTLVDTNAAEHSVAMNAPFRASGMVWRAAGAGPALGEHTMDVLTVQLGYSEDEVQLLFACGAIS